MDYNEEDYLQISGLQHYSFCKRQWALIVIENYWKENLLTATGHLFHERAHDGAQTQWKSDRLITRGMRVHSPTMGLSGSCDVVEFIPSEQGISLADYEGTYIPYPIEYKKGAPRADHANELQLCAQAMCLEEMLCCDINVGALFFGETRRREEIVFSKELRKEVVDTAKEMHQLLERKHTPKVKPTKMCNSCSLKEYCLPKLQKKKSVMAYLQKHMEDEP